LQQLAFLAGKKYLSDGTTTSRMQYNSKAKRQLVAKETPVSSA